MIDETKWDRGHYKSGQLEYEIPYVNGQGHGIIKCWHSNGQLNLETPYVNGERHGIRRVWDSDGQLWSMEKFHRDQKVIGLRFYLIPGDATMELDLTTNEMSYE